MSKLMLLAACAGFSCGGSELEVIATEAGPAVDVPDEFVADALWHGLIDLDEQAERDAADAEAKVAAASEAVAAAKRTKASRAAVAADALAAEPEVPA